MRALVIGYFSTVGDLEVLSVVRSWLEREGLEHDTSAYHAAVSNALVGSLPLNSVKPERYSHLLVVCGPFWREFFVGARFDLDRFSHCTRIGVNLSMIAPLEDYDPFDAFVGRDSDQWSFPDLSFLDVVDRIPVVGLCLAPPQREYKKRQAHDQAANLLHEAARCVGVAVQVLDTRWPVSRNDGAVDSPMSFESILARCDALLTTRLHGAVLALKSGVPVVALDPVVGGDKVVRQMQQVAWPRVRAVDEANVDGLADDLRWCLTSAARDEARRSADRGRQGAGALREVFCAALAAEPQGRDADTRLPLLPSGGRRPLRNALTRTKPIRVMMRSLKGSEPS